MNKLIKEYNAFLLRIAAILTEHAPIVLEEEEVEMQAERLVEHLIKFDDVDAEIVAHAAFAMYALWYGPNNCPELDDAIWDTIAAKVMSL